MTDPAPPVHDAASPGVPAKCIACHRELNSPAVCDYCHTLNPINAPTDYFQLLGVDRRFDLDTDELRKKFLALNRHAHPDFHTHDTPEVRELSLNVASAVNDAYRTLNDPISRAEYLLEILGGPSSAADKSTPDGLVAEMMQLQERIDEAPDEDQLAPLAAELRLRLEGMVEKLGELFARIGGDAACEAVRQSTLRGIRRHLNAISYLRRLVNMTQPK